MVLLYRYCEERKIRIRSVCQSCLLSDVHALEFHAYGMAAITIGLGLRRDQSIVQKYTIVDALFLVTPIDLRFSGEARLLFGQG